MLIVNTNLESTQEALGTSLARSVPRTGFIIYLQGVLGVGKTTLARGFLRGLGYAGIVKSPTYTLVEPYQVQGRTVLHLDLYRIANPLELDYLGLEDIAEVDTIWLIEWPKRGSGRLPAPDLVVEGTHQPGGRRLVFIPKTDLGASMLARFQEDHT